MSDADVDRIWSYMQTVDPVRRATPSNMLAWPFNIRSLMAAWNWLYFKPVSSTPQAGKSAVWNHGAYLVTGPGHCGTCHTPKTLLGGDTPAALTGASLQGWFAPDITADSKGVGKWSVADVVTYLKTGHNAHSMASGPMAEAIEYSTSKMTDSDLNAIAVYLKDAPASAGGLEGGAVARNDSRMKAGAAIYADNCQGCHNRDGSGQNAIFPPFAGNPIVSQSSAETLVRVVLAGTQGAETPSAPTAPAMPSFAWRLTDSQVADVLTYVRGSWGNAGPVSPGTVAQIRRELKAPD
jgi:mono/diheme cytochrome c family protein